MEEVSTRLKALLKALNTNQLKLSKATGITQTFISSIILGKADISREVLRKLALKYPNINLTWLLTGQGEMFMQNSGPIDKTGISEYKNNVLNVDVPDDASLRRTLAINLLTLAKRWGMKKNELVQALVPGTKKPTVTNYFSGKSQLPLFALVRLEDLTGIGLSTWITHELQERELPFEPIQARKGGADQLEDIKAGLRALLNKL